jgi:hypothetical protein
VAGHCAHHYRWLDHHLGGLVHHPVLLLRAFLLLLLFLMPQVLR